jgi:biotin carboxylase
MSWIGLVGASPGGARALRRLRDLHEAAAPPVVVIADRGRPIGPEVAATADHIAIADTADPLSVQAAVGTTRAHLGDPVFLAAFSERAQSSTAAVAEALNLPTVGRAAVERTQDKERMRRHLSNTSWSWPFLAGTVNDLREGLHDRARETAWVVKPVDGVGSVDVSIVNGPDEVERWLRRHVGDPTRWIAEKLADGVELSVEAVSYSENHDIIAVTSKLTTGAPSFVETGHCVPADLAPAVLDRVAQEVRDLLTMLGVNAGASHTELRLQADGTPMLIETHTRPGGDCIPELAEYVTGRDQYLQAITSQWGLDIGEIAPAAATASAAGVAFLTASHRGRLCSVRNPDPDPSVTIVRTELTVPLGAIVAPPCASGDRLGHLVVTAADSYRVIEALTRILEAPLCEIS